MAKSVCSREGNGENPDEIEGGDGRVGTAGFAGGSGRGWSDVQNNRGVDRRCSDEDGRIGEFWSLNIDGVVGKITALSVPWTGASALPTQAALVGFGVLALYALLGKIMNTAKKTSGDFVKIALFATITWTIAKQICSNYT